jgi:two-component system, sensor histidine kinase and response regulator
MSQEQRDRPNRILLIAQQQPSSLASLEALLRSQGYEVAIATNSDEALCQIERVAPWLKQWFEQRHGYSQLLETAIADILHDVRMPLTAANQLLEEIKASALGEMSAEVRAALAQIATSNQALLHLIEMRLSIHQYEVGGMELSFFPVDLVELSASVIETLKPLAMRKGLDLRLIEGAEGLPEVRGDRLELQRLFTNLIDNAIRFTDVGFVEVCVNSNIDTDERSGIAISISDTGIGIAEDEQATLFERFRQGQPRRSGHGLGLYLCRQIVEAHQGQIEVQSTLGQGSCFIVYLPRHRA